MQMILNRRDGDLSRYFVIASSRMRMRITTILEKL